MLHTHPGHSLTIFTAGTIFSSTSVRGRHRQRHPRRRGRAGVTPVDRSWPSGDG